MDQEVGGGFRSFLAAQFAAFAGFACLTAVVSMLTVFLAAKYGDKNSAPIAMGLVGLSYLFSLAFSGAAEDHRFWTLPYLLMGIGSLVVVLEYPRSGLFLSLLGIGFFRPVVIYVTSLSRPASAGRAQAFAYLGITINGAYLAGPALAEVLRARSWASVFWATGILSMIGLGCVSLVRPSRQPSISSPISSQSGSWVVFLAVGLTYAILGQLSSVLALVAEHQSTAMIIGGHTLKLRAGSLAALHGLLAGIASAGYVKLVPRTAKPALMSALGMAFYGLAFAALSCVMAFLSDVWLVVLFSLFSVSESIISPNLLALASGLSGSSRSAYWLVAGLGYASGALFAVGESTPAPGYYRVIAVVCVLVALALAFSRRNAVWAGK